MDTTGYAEVTTTPPAVVWVVTLFKKLFDEDEEPIVTVFSSEEAANNYKEYMRHTIPGYTRVCIDKTFPYANFKKEEK